MDQHAAPLLEVVDSETLFRRHAPFVASFLARHGVHGADLDDAVQEVFLSAHRKGGYRPGLASATTFLARLALEVNLTRRRGEGRRQRDSLEQAAEVTLGTGPAAPDAALARKQAARQLEALLSRMEEGQRSVFILFELEGESCAAIAAGLELPVGTVHSRLHLARKSFREAVARALLRDRGAPQYTQSRPPGRSQP